MPSGGSPSPADAGKLFLVREGTPGSCSSTPRTGQEGKCEAEVEQPFAVGTDAAGNAYVRDEAGGHPVRELGADCKEVADSQFPFEDGFATSYGIATGSACLSEGINLYVGSNGLGGVNSFVRAYGSPPDIHTGVGEICEAPKNPPTIVDQIASSVEYEGAVVRAQIDPRFWKDTTYYVEYGPGVCSEGGCPDKRPVPPGPTLT